jgi:hypothetical protein
MVYGFVDVVPNRPFGNFENGGRFSTGQALGLDEDKRMAMLLGKRRDGAIEVNAIDGAGIGPIRRLIGKIGFRVYVGPPRSQSAPSQQGYTVEPRSQRAAPFEPLNPAKSADKDLLSEVFRV